MTSKRVTRLSVLIAVLSLPAVLAAQTTCPPTTPAPGSTVNGGEYCPFRAHMKEARRHGSSSIRSGRVEALSHSGIREGVSWSPRFTVR